MDDDRKYRQHGYQDSGRDFRPERERPRPQGPKLPIDVTGPRLPRLVQAVTASRCFNCAATVAADVDLFGKCPKCGAALHCCKQCAHFEPSTRFQCLKPIPVRIAPKDTANECNLFKMRVTVAREVAGPVHQSPLNGFDGASATPRAHEPRVTSDAKTAFDNLFKK